MKARDKRFINNSFNESGAVSWHVSTGETDWGFSNLVNAELQISDCSKTICLDFNVEKETHFDKRIGKLDELMTSLTLMREALVEAKAEHKGKKKFYY